MNQPETRPMAKDPVCGMDVDPNVARASGLSSEHDGQTYSFCGKGCKLDFDDEPGKFLGAGQQPHM